MKWISLGKRGGVGILALSACAATAAPLFSMGEDAPTWTAAGGDETVIKLKCDLDSQPIVLKLDDLRVGETRDVRSESGKDVTVTRYEGGYKLKVGEKEIDVKTPGAMPGGSAVVLSGGDGTAPKKMIVMNVSGDAKAGSERKMFIHKGGGAAYAFHTGGAAPLRSAEELLDKQDLEALKGADRRTRDTVAKALTELMEKGVVFSPSCHLGGFPGEAVEIEVEQKTK